MVTIGFVSLFIAMTDRSADHLRFEPLQPSMPRRDTTCSRNNCMRIFRFHREKEGDYTERKLIKSGEKLGA
jgi:hypothetical protein